MTIFDQISAQIHNLLFFGEKKITKFGVLEKRQVSSWKLTIFGHLVKSKDPALLKK